MKTISIEATDGQYHSLVQKLAKISYFHFFAVPQQMEIDLIRRKDKELQSSKAETIDFNKYN